MAEKVAAGFAEKAGAGEGCRTRRIGGLLGLSSVRMAVGMTLSLVFAQVRRNSAQSPKPQDSRDLQHAVMAAARASMFVTGDKKLIRLVKRVPVPRFEVLKLSDFLARLRSPIAV
jgi:predicted nucleic acid-binding protein